MNRSMTGFCAPRGCAVAPIKGAGWAFTTGGCFAVSEHADLPLVDLIEPEGRRRPANVDLAGHHLRERRGRAAGRHHLGFEAELLDEGVDDAVRRGAVGRIRDGV